MKVAELVATLGFITDPKGLKEFEKNLESAKTMALGVGATIGAVAAGIGFAFKEAFQGADEAATAAERLGLTTNALLALRFAADRADVTAEELGGSLKFLSKNAAEAAANSGSGAAKAFARLGIRVKDASGQLKSADVLLQDVATGFERLSASEKTGVSLELLGRGGTALVPLLNKGGKALDETKKRARLFGLELSENTQKNVGAFSQSLKDFRDASKGAMNKLLKALPAVNKLFTKIVDFVIAKMPELEEFIGRVAAKLELWVHNLDVIFAFFQNRNLVGLITKGVLAIAATWVILNGAAVTAGLSMIASFAGVAIAAGLLLIIIDEIEGALNGEDTFILRLEKWANSFDPNNSPVILFLQKLVAYLQDIGSMDKLQVLLGMKKSIAEQQYEAKTGLSAVPKEDGSSAYMNYLKLLPGVGPVVSSAFDTHRMMQTVTNNNTNNVNIQAKADVQEVKQVVDGVLGGKLTQAKAAGTNGN